MDHRRPGWSHSVNSGDSDQHHLRFYVNARAKREDETQVVWRLSLNNHETKTYEYVWLIEAEVLALIAVKEEAQRFMKANYYLRSCGKRVANGAIGERRG